MEKLKGQVNDFVNERIIEELYENGFDDNEYSREIHKIMEVLRDKLGEDSNTYRMIDQLQDLYLSEIVYRDEKAYSLGFRDGLKLEKVLSEI